MSWHDWTRNIAGTKKKSRPRRKSWKKFQLQPIKCIHVEARWSELVYVNMSSAERKITINGIARGFRVKGRRRKNPSHKNLRLCAFEILLSFVKLSTFPFSYFFSPFVAHSISSDHLIYIIRRPAVCDRRTNGQLNNRRMNDNGKFKFKFEFFFN